MEATTATSIVVGHPHNKVLAHDNEKCTCFTTPPEQARVGVVVVVALLVKQLPGTVHCRYSDERVDDGNVEEEQKMYW